jgi:hypothetical protein
MRIATVILLVTLFGCCKSYDFPAAKKRDKLLIKELNLDYKEIVKEPMFNNLNMLGEVKKGGVYGQRLYGMILRSLRFKNITDAVEKKYKLPENLMLAMIMHESGGVDLLPNSSDDGGIGLIHMQPKLAKQFGLKTYKNCEQLVCRKHGKELRKLIIKNNYDRKKLIEYDDRFNPILNIDAAARMLVYYRSGKQVKNTPLKTAIYGYAGRYNYSKYYDNIVLYMEKLQDKSLIEDIEEDFNEQNQLLTINGKKADFKDYLEAHQKQNVNYGLRDYN